MQTKNTSMAITELIRSAADAQDQFSADDLARFARALQPSAVRGPRTADDPMTAKNSQITIRKIDVELDWTDCPSAGSVGRATHTVTTDQMEAGYGPVDGETFTIGGKKYCLGQHDYSTDQPGNDEDDDECTCSAAIYEETR